ncbi:hypothetical protein CBR69_22165 [Bordetella hinzii]|nr:hypothetical protein CBR69_22165 [Bordetella hinzii]
MNSEISHFHLFSGAGVGAAGMQDARPEIPGLAGRMVCLGGVDVDAAGAADFYQFTGVRCTVRDLFSRQQYTAFHGREPADGWVEAEQQGAPFQMEGSSDSAHRERIGNAVPRKAAKAMAEEIGRAILLVRAGESFQLSSTPIWVRHIATALAVRGGV